MVTTLLAALAALVPVLLAAISLYAQRQSAETTTNRDAAAVAAQRVADVKASQIIQQAQELAGAAIGHADGRVQQFYVD